MDPTLPPNKVCRSSGRIVCVDLALVDLYANGAADIGVAGPPTPSREDVVWCVCVYVLRGIGGSRFGGFWKSSWVCGF